MKKGRNGVVMKYGVAKITIFYDFVAHNEISNVWQPLLMAATEPVLSPLAFIYDVIRSFI